jgi:hypothetical protein
MATRMTPEGVPQQMESPTINQSMGPEASQMMMQPDDEMRVVLLSRLEQLTPPELQALDSVIDGAAARVLLKLLPELEEVIGMIAAQVGESGDEGRGALASM